MFGIWEHFLLDRASFCNPTIFHPVTSTHPPVHWLLTPSSGEGPWHFIPQGSAPPTPSSSPAHRGGLESLITRRSNRDSGLPWSPAQASIPDAFFLAAEIALQRASARNSLSQLLFPSFFTLFSFFFTPPTQPKVRILKRKMMKVKGPIFLHFSFLPRPSCSCSPGTDWPQKMCTRACASLPLWPNVSLSERKMDARVPFLSPRAPCLASAGLVCTCILWYSASVQPVDCL